MAKAGTKEGRARAPIERSAPFLSQGLYVAEAKRQIGSALVLEIKMNRPVVIVDPEIQSGAPVFAGTRLPIQNLFDYLEEGDSLEVFLDQFPSVSREMAVAVLEQAREALAHDAHPA